MPTNTHFPHVAVDVLISMTLQEKKAAMFLAITAEVMTFALRTLTRPSGCKDEKKEVKFTFDMTIDSRRSL